MRSTSSSTGANSCTSGGVPATARTYMRALPTRTGMSPSASRTRSVEAEERLERLLQPPIAAPAERRHRSRRRHPERHAATDQRRRRGRGAAGAPRRSANPRCRKRRRVGVSIPKTSRRVWTVSDAISVQGAGLDHSRWKLRSSSPSGPATASRADPAAPRPGGQRMRSRQEVVAGRFGTEPTSPAVRILDVGLGPPATLAADRRIRNVSGLMRSRAATRRPRAPPSPALLRPSPGVVPRPQLCRRPRQRDPLQVERVELGDQARSLLHHRGPLVERLPARPGELVVAPRRAPSPSSSGANLSRLLEVTQRPVDLADVHRAVGDPQLRELAHDRVAVRRPVRQEGEDEGFHPAVVRSDLGPAAVDGSAVGVAAGRDPKHGFRWRRGIGRRGRSSCRVRAA